MPRLILTKKWYSSFSFQKLQYPLYNVLEKAPLLESRCNRVMQMGFNDQLKAFIFFHPEEHTSGSQLIQTLKDDVFAREHIVPKKALLKVHSLKP